MEEGGQQDTGRAPPTGLASTPFIEGKWSVEEVKANTRPRSPTQKALAQEGAFQIQIRGKKPTFPHFSCPLVPLVS